LAHWEGFKVTEKIVNHRPRQFGKSKYGIMRYFHGFFDLITITFLKKYMRRPLHFFGTLGIIFFILGCMPLIYFLVQWFKTGELHIRPLMLGGIGLVIMSIQFFSIGLIGEMITFYGRSDEIEASEEVNGGTEKNS
ncbi:MAG: glycosyltransferase, partial [Elusimicrobiota bacterium]